MNKDIFDKVVETICKITGLEPQIITEEMLLDSPEIGMSSLDIVEALVELEDFYNIQFLDSPLDIKVIKNIVSIIETQLSQLNKRNEKVFEAFANLFGKDE